MEKDENYIRRTTYGTPENYYNMLPDGYWRKTAESIDDTLDQYTRAKTGGWIAGKLGKYF